MKSLLLLFIAILSTTLLQSQCPQTSQITSSGKCIRISYTTPPSPLPAYLIYNGVQYNFQAGAGTVGSPAEYKDPGATGACSSYSGANANITLPSGTVCTYTGGVLPVKFIAFEGELNNFNLPRLSWKVQESLVDKYEIEKSKDGNAFYSIATISSKGDGVNVYTFSDVAALQGFAYFRIKQTDLNGHSAYSIIIKIASSTNKSLVSIYPNPATDKLVITSGTDLRNTIAAVSDVSGKEIMQIVLKNQAITVDISKIPQGLYLLRFMNGTSHKFLKQH
jgi:Secretion system C-terminal sorting domain